MGTMTVGDASDKKATEAFRNLVTELWYACSSPLAMPKRFNPIESYGSDMYLFSFITQQNVIVCMYVYE